MPAEALALVSAAAFGLNHFWGGVLSRRADPWAVALIGQFGGLAAVGVGCLVLGGDPQWTDLAWGLLSGVGSGLGVAYLYRGMVAGNVSVVVPLSDVAAVALPVLVGVAALGERPTALGWTGIALALPALWAISRTRGTAGGRSAGTADAVVAGVGFAVQFLAVAQVAPAALLWPILAARVGSIGTIGLLMVRRRQRIALSTGALTQSVCIGILGSAGLALYMLATQQQLLVLATVLSSLYPVIPVVLALVLLRERPNRVQIAGMCAAFGAIACLSVS